MWSNKDCEDFSWRFMQYALLDNLNILNTLIKVSQVDLVILFGQLIFGAIFMTPDISKKKTKKYFGYVN